MQDPNEDTEWNDILRKKGIIPEKEKKVEDDDILFAAHEIKQAQMASTERFGEFSLDELNEQEDDIDEDEERAFELYRQQRMAEMKATQARSRFGDVLEISREDYVREVNNAGENIWVILHIYKPSIPLCKLINQYMTNLSQKFPECKFVKSISSVCIPNYPDKNLPTIFIYKAGEMKKQFVGPHEFGGMNLTQDFFEWMLGKVGAVKTEIEECPKKEVKDVMTSSIRQSGYNDSDDDDW